LGVLKSCKSNSPPPAPPTGTGMHPSTPDAPVPAPKSGRGGKRPGAGRKRKEHVSPSGMASIDVAAALAEPPPDEIESVAQRHARQVVATLVTQLQHGKSDPARIKAAGILLDRGYGKPSVEPGGDMVLPLFPTAPARDLSTEIRDTARKHAHLAVAVLARIATGSESESARVSAAQVLLDRGLGMSAAAKLPEGQFQKELGKKDQLAAEAKDLATGVYAPPPPPTARIVH